MPALDEAVPGGERPMAEGRRVTTIVGALRDAVAHAPGRTALTCDDQTLTYAEFGRAADALAARLAAAGARGGTVALAMPNSPRMAVAIFAVWAAGARIACLNPGYTPAELTPLLRASAPALVLTDAAAEAPGPHDAATELGLTILPVTDQDLRPDGPTPEAVGDPAPGDRAALLFTGGTTGLPKGVEYTHEALLRTVEGAELCWPTRLDEETWLNVAPMFHIWGLAIGFLHPVYARGGLVMVPRFVPATVVQELERHRATMFSGGPAAVYGGVLSVPALAEADLSALRVCQGGGSAISADLQERWQTATGLPIHEAYGMTELAPIACNPAGAPPRPGSVGLPTPGVQIQIVDLTGHGPLPTGETGEIRVRAPYMLHHYLGLDGAPIEALTDGWFPTGDMGRFDEDGYLHIVDRKKDMIIVGGFNVYPREIDDVLLAHPAVAESATVGVPDERKGERPVAFVAAGPDAPLDPAELTEHCARHLAAYKQPVRIIAVPQLPRTPANKIDRIALRRHPALASGTPPSTS
ncbi:long-chain acyl-CoA synthetase [Actinomadura pelletieri DSM 43383]|uniref:Long-chain acyl-CoA synthetase n=1 Tax=Actinomadura pelletieri DSM 43383 TaxID=1120940 RepID=A0A495QT46_9ACTN|nr:AMP-binding protein [Actinomadura pelletieri]RKS76675.1 long-chain acyl-CoA synthetase [Actinomadura pelletieri DSM 43383]